MTLRGFCLVGFLVAICWLPGHVAAQSCAKPSVEQVLAAVDAAKGQFRPLTDADAQTALADVKAAAASLEERLDASEQNGPGWKTYLGWDKLQEQLKQAKPDKATLATAYTKLAAGYDGLELKWFARTRNALDQYLKVLGGIGNKDLPPAYEDQLVELAKHLKAWSATPTTDSALEVAANLAWIESARQAPEMAQLVHAEFGQPNMRGHIGIEILEAMLASEKDVDETAPIDDCILGTSIHGEGRTVGQTHVALGDNPSAGFFDVVMQGTNTAQNVGWHRPVWVYSTSTTQLGTCKRFWIDEDGVHGLPTVARACTDTNIYAIHDIKCRRLVERFAWRRAMKQKGEVDAIASDHAADRAAERCDERAVPHVDEANSNYEKKIRQPLGDRLIFPHDLAFSTTVQAIHIAGFETMLSQLASPTPAPAMSGPSEGSMQMHESAINNMAATVLGGMRMTEDMFQKTIKEIVGKVPDQLKPDPNQEPFTVVFPREDPVTVAFTDNGFTVTLRGHDFISGDRHLRDTNISATYKFVKTDKGFKAVRQGPLTILPAGMKERPHVGILGEQMYVILQNRFGKIFSPEQEVPGFTPSGRLEKAGKFVPVVVDSAAEWLSIGWSRESTVKAAAK
jgi:hypothetical protein